MLFGCGKDGEELVIFIIEEFIDIGWVCLFDLFGCYYRKLRDLKKWGSMRWGMGWIGKYKILKWVGVKDRCLKIDLKFDLRLFFVYYFLFLIWGDCLIEKWWVEMVWKFVGV